MFKPGDTVRFSADFLRNTGQISGHNPRRKFRVITCGCGLCQNGNHLAVNEKTEWSEGWRHIAIANLELAKPS